GQRGGEADLGAAVALKADVVAEDGIAVGVGVDVDHFAAGHVDGVVGESEVFESAAVAVVAVVEGIVVVDHDVVDDGDVGGGIGDVVDLVGELDGGALVAAAEVGGVAGGIKEVAFQRAVGGVVDVEVRAVVVVGSVSDGVAVVGEVEYDAFALVFVNGAVADG